MKTIIEITLQDIAGSTSVQTDKNVKVLHAEYNRGNIELTLEKTIDALVVWHLYRPFALGEQIPDGWNYVATVKERGGLLHIYHKLQ